MTNSLTLATTTHGGFPAPLTILLAVAAVGYVLLSRMKGQPLKLKRLVVLPAVLTVIGITDFTGSSVPRLTPKDIAFLVVSVVISAVLGAARGATIELYPQQGELWQRYRRNTVGLWIALIATKLVLTVIASGAGASKGGGTNSLLLSLGVSLLAEAAIVAPRALSSGVPFAVDHKGARSGPSLVNRFLAVAPTQEHSISSTVDATAHTPAPTRAAGDPDNARLWRSPTLSDGVNWLRHQIDQPESKRWSQPVPSRASTGGAGHHHDHHHHGLTGPR